MTKFKNYMTGGVLGLLLGLAFLGTAATVSYFGSGSADQLGVSLATLISGEDQTNNVLRTEQQFSVGVDDADLVVKSSPGFLHSVWCYEEDTAPTAGTVRITNTTAAGGAETTEVWGKDITTTVGSGTAFAVLDIVMTTGIVIDFTTTADVKCGVSYR